MFEGGGDEYDHSELLALLFTRWLYRISHGKYLRQRI
jgi:hypothetical protein